MTTHGSSNTWGHFLMHENKYTHHGDPPSPRWADGHHDARVGVHTLYNLYIYLTSRRAGCRGSTALQPLQPSTALYSYTAIHPLHSTTLYSTPLTLSRQAGPEGQV